MLMTISKFYPSVYEVNLAKKIMQEEWQKHAKSVLLPSHDKNHMSIDVAMSCCVGRVWEKAREYQSKLTEETEKKQRLEKQKEEKKLQEIMNINGVDCYEKEGVVWLKLEAVARGLGFTQGKNGVEYVKWERVSTYLMELGFSPQVGKDIFIPENIFYRLAMKAKNETAEKFQALVADEIIPSIRKHGAYLTPQKMEEILLNPDTMIRLLQEIKDEREKVKVLEEKVEEDRPLVTFANSVTVANTSILIGELAKLLKQNGVDMGQNRLFEWMRREGFLIRRKGSDYNMPTQRSMDMKLFEIKETTISHADGHTSINKTPKVTGKGQIYFINRFLCRA